MLLGVQWGGVLAGVTGRGAGGLRIPPGEDSKQGGLAGLRLGNDRLDELPAGAGLPSSAKRSWRKSFRGSSPAT